MGEGKKGKTTSITKEREQSISITPRRKIGTTQSEFHLRSGEPQPPQVTDDEEEKEEKKVKKDKKDKKEKGKDRQKDRDREREKEREAGQKRWSAEVDVGASNSPSSSSQGTPSHSSSSSPTSNYSLSPRVIMKSKAPDEADGLMSADRVQLSLDSTYGGMKPSSDAAGVTSGAVQTVIAAGKKTPRSNKVAKIGDFSGLSSSRENKDKKKRRRPSVPSMENFRHRSLTSLTQKRSSPRMNVDALVRCSTVNQSGLIREERSGSGEGSPARVVKVVTLPPEQKLPQSASPVPKSKGFASAFAAVRAGNMQLLKRSFTEELSRGEWTSAVCFQTQQGTTLLHIAAGNGLLDMLTYLLERCQEGESEEASARDGKDKDLSSSAKKGSSKERRTPRGIDISSGQNARTWEKTVLAVNLADETGLTPLLCALSQKRYDAALLLVQKGAECRVQNKDGIGVMHYLAQYELDSKSSELQTFVELFQCCLRNGASLYVRNKNGEYPVHLASLKGCANTLKLFLSLGCIANLPNASGDTLLHYAVQLYHIQEIEVLLSLGADPLIANSQGQLPIDLLELRTFSTKDKMQESKQQIMKLLSTYHARPELVRPSLHHAALNGNIEAISSLIKENRVLPLTDLDGMTALHFSIIHRHWKCANGNTALHYLARQVPTPTEVDEYVPLLCALIQNGFPLDKANYRGETALHLAALHRNSLVSEYLLANISQNCNLDEHMRTIQGETPLHYAFIGQQYETACFLMGRGCDPDCEVTLNAGFRETGTSIARSHNRSILYT